jgi:hypothetical protein
VGFQRGFAAYFSFSKMGGWILRGLKTTASLRRCSSEVRKKANADPSAPVATATSAQDYFSLGARLRRALFFYKGVVTVCGTSELVPFQNSKKATADSHSAALRAGFRLACVAEGRARSLKMTVLR